RDRHLQLFLQVAEEAQSQYVGPAEVEWLERLETEHDNLRAALEWSLTTVDSDSWLVDRPADKGPESDLSLSQPTTSHQPRSTDPEIGLRLAAALGWFWFLHVHRREGVQWLEQLLARPPGAPTIARARALDAVGLLTIYGPADQAQRRLEESLALSRQLGYDP